MDEEIMHDCCCATCIFNNSKDNEIAYCTLNHKETAIDNSCNEYDDGDCGDLHHVW